MVSEEVVESVSSSKFQADPEIYKFQSNKKAVIENSFFKHLIFYHYFFLNLKNKYHTGWSFLTCLLYAAHCQFKVSWEPF